MKRLSLFLILALPLTPAALMAQEVISSGGTCVKVSGISLSWTVGEPVTETLSSGSLTLTQGFHQTRLSASTIDEIVTPGLKLTIYPNPFTCMLNLKVTEGDFSQLSYTLFTMDGKEKILKKISANLTRIDMQAYPSGNYLIKIKRKNGDPVKTWKIVKQ